ncbi:LIM domain and actin-binding protein 1 [Blyttiomyces sp. JEL0837]|nr:LIM domain and actin-binding protein 1 [Blyttiomyces sp. JEL0837]
MNPEIAARIQFYTDKGGVKPGDYSRGLPAVQPNKASQQSYGDRELMKETQRPTEGPGSLKARMDKFTKVDENRSFVAPSSGKTTYFARSQQQQQPQQPQPQPQQQHSKEQSSQQQQKQQDQQQQQQQQPQPSASPDHQPPSLVRRASSQVSGVDNNPALVSHRTSLASRRESISRESFEMSLPEPANMDQVSKGISERIETLREVAHASNPISPVEVPPVAVIDMIRKGSVAGGSGSGSAGGSPDVNVSAVKGILMQRESSSASSSNGGTPRYGSAVAGNFGAAVGGSKCATCAKTVYVVEQLLYDGQVFHKACLKCTHCNTTLKLKDIASLEGKYYCKPHFKQLFKLKGNYAEGFGKEDHKKQWSESSSS